MRQTIPNIFFGGTRMKIKNICLKKHCGNEVVDLSCCEIIFKQDSIKFYVLIADTDRRVVYISSESIIRSFIRLYHTCNEVTARELEETIDKTTKLVYILDNPEFDTPIDIFYKDAVDFAVYLMDESIQIQTDIDITRKYINKTIEDAYEATDDIDDDDYIDNGNDDEMDDIDNGN